MPSNKEIQAKRAEANSLTVSLQVGKAGVTESTVDELSNQLEKRRLVKVRLLKSATHETGNQVQADALATATGAILVDVRGHTAVYWKP